MVKSKIKLQPLGDRVVVQRDASEEVTTGGIVLPDSAKDVPARGTVMSVGDGIMMPDGSRVALQLTVGARVIFSSYGGEAIDIDDEDYEKHESVNEKVASPFSNHLRNAQEEIEWMIGEHNDAEGEGVYDKPKEAMKLLQIAQKSLGKIK